MHEPERVMEAKTWRWMTAWAAAGVLAAAALGGCQSAPGGDASAAAVRPDVADIRPAGRVATAAGPAAAEPPVYDMSGLIPTAPQPLTEPPAAPAAAAVSPSPSPVMFAAAPPSAPAVESHTVRRGETLFAIAKACYGDGSQWKRLAAANPAVAGGPLRVGQQLVVP